MKIKFIILLLLMFVSTACGQVQSHEAQKEKPSKTKEFTVTIKVYDNEIKLNEEMDKLFKEISSVDREEFVNWVMSRDLETIQGCTIYSVKPKVITPKVPMFTWSHEIAHCVYNSFYTVK